MTAEELKQASHYNKGTEDGINWYVDFSSKDMRWTIIVEKDGEIKQDSFPTCYAPVCGMDVADANRADILLDKFINEFKGIGQED